MPLSDGLISYWPMQSGGVVDRRDAVGSSVLGHLGNADAPSGVTGVRGNATDWDASEGAGAFAAATVGELNENDFSVSLWFNASDLGPSLTPIIASKLESVTVFWQIFLSSGQVRFNLGDGTTFPNLLVGTVTADTTYHLVVTRDSSTGVVSGYLNGVVASTSGFTGDIATGNTGRFGIFNRDLDSDFTGANQFDGWVDEIGYWDRALTPAEVASLYNSGSGNFYSNNIPAAFDTEVSPAGVAGSKDYTAIANKALALIQKFGRTVVFRKLDRTTLDEPGKPWRGTATPRVIPDASVTASAVSVSPSGAAALGIATEDSELVKRSSEILIVALGATSTDDLATFDEVLDGTLLWKVQVVDTLKPANLTLLYFVGVTR